MATTRLASPTVLLLTAGLLVGGLATGTAPVAATPTATRAPAATPLAVPLPTVSLIPGRRIFGAATQNLRRVGYTEREYRVTVADPHVYAYVGEGTEVSRTPAPAAPAGAYRTRMIVRAPADRRDFNGRVLVEMMNTTAGLDLDIAWMQAHRHLIREGWAYVGVTVQQTGLNALGFFERGVERYTGGPRFGLMTPDAAALPFPQGARDPSIAWDLVSQVGQLVTSRTATNPLRDLRPRRTYLTGQSQMAGYAVTYVNAIHPLARVYDGFLVVSRSPRATNLGFTGNPPVPTSTTPAQLRLAGGGTPVINIQTETDLSDDPAVRRGDADTPGDRFRLWEVAGSAHNDEWVSLQSIARIERDLPFAPPSPCPWPAPDEVTDFPVRYSWHAALAGLDRWASDGVAPPSAPLVALEGTTVVRDADGNAVGGLRLPALDVPVATYAPRSPGEGFCGLTGTKTPWSRAELRQRYPSVAAYTAAVATAARADRRAGLLLAADVKELRRAAARGPVTWGRS